MGLGARKIVERVGGRSLSTSAERNRKVDAMELDGVEAYDGEYEFDDQDRAENNNK
jgi:hypothetical protein